MKYKTKNEYFTVELEMNESEIQAIVCLIEELQYLKRQEMHDLVGLRKNIYEDFMAILSGRNKVN